MIWFTADHHFGHANIIKHCNRPFKDVHEMNTIMANKWNEKIGPKDLVYHLGDFAMGDHHPYMKRLHGAIKILIKGNHDHSKYLKYAHWDQTYDLLNLTIEDIPLTLCHYGMRVWHKSHHGAIHLYGHSHGTLPGTAKSMDVGVDCHDFYPISWEEVKNKLGVA